MKPTLTNENLNPSARMSAPANASKLPPRLVLKDPKGKTIARTWVAAAALIHPLLKPGTD
jgi:hypothetical protein